MTKQRGGKLIDEWLFAAQDKPTLRLEQLLSSNTEVELTGSHGVSALMAAAGRGRFENVRLLLSHGANVNLQDVQGADPLSGQSALMFAANSGQVEITKLLLDQGAYPNAQDKDRNGVNESGLQWTLRSRSNIAFCGGRPEID